MILITGATGTVGSLLIPKLTAKGHNVRALTRNANVKFETGVQKVIGDLTDPKSLALAVKDVSQVFMVSDGTDLALKDRNIISAAKAVGVQHIVKLSVLSASHMAKDPITQWHMAGEDALRSSGVNWTMLRPNGFMSNALNWSHTIAAQSKVYAPFGEGCTSIVDPSDIAGVALACLTQAGHESKIYELTGPEALSVPEQVTILAKELGKSIEYVSITPEASAKTLTTYGMKPDLAEAVIAMFASALDPRNGEVSNAINKVTAQSPKSFREWAKYSRRAFELYA